MQRYVRIAVFIALAFNLSSNVWASTPVSGSITATQTCEAYVSKNKRTNPDLTRLVVNQEYSIFEANKSSNPDWYRVRIQSASPAERWVSVNCGTIKLASGGGSQGSGGGQSGGEQRGSCNTPGLEDSYVLALSWQPAFCDTHRNKPECQIDDKKSYQARNFTLHGLWPNKASCGKNYGFCGDVRSSPGDFCDYPMLQLFTEVRAELSVVMPSAAAGSCLQRHEWFKHGTCQLDWSMDKYFETAVELTQQFNESGIAYFINRHIGKTVSEKDFINKVDCAQGTDAHKRLELTCKSGYLVDVYIHLPGTIKESDDLGSLMQQGQGDFKSNCGGQFKIDPIGFQ